jgi:hypothetical protein
MADWLLSDYVGGNNAEEACDLHAISMRSACDQHAISMQSAYLRQPVRLGTLAIRFDEMRCNQSSPEPFELQSDVPASNEGRQSACN